MCVLKNFYRDIYSNEEGDNPRDSDIKDDLIAQLAERVEELEDHQLQGMLQNQGFSIKKYCFCSQ